MKSTQQKLEAYIDECAEECNSEITQDKDFNNTGYFTLFRGEDTYDVRFDFQTRYCTLKFSTGGDHYYDYVKDMPLLKQHLKSFVKFGDPRVWRP